MKEKTKKEAVETKKETKKVEKTERKAKSRGKKYQEVKAKINRENLYTVAEAVKLVKEVSISKFTGNLEVHLVVNNTGDLGDLILPHFKSKEKKVVIANEKVVAEIKDGKINFDILLASTQMMPKLLPFARVLGPKGLMPNPKNGTLVDDPEKALKKFTGGGIKVRTEKKAPLVHIVIGKLDQPEKELAANLEALIKTITVPKIKKITISPTMGPGIKIKI